MNQATTILTFTEPVGALVSDDAARDAENERDEIVEERHTVTITPIALTKS